MHDTMTMDGSSVKSVARRTSGADAPASDDIRSAWRDRAGELAEKVLREWVIRTDVWGGYLPRHLRPTKARQDGTTYVQKSVTKPSRLKRGVVTLTADVIRRHFEGRDGDIIGLHTTGPGNTSVRFAIEVDAHEGQQCDPEANRKAALFWHAYFVSKGLDVLLTDSNGTGGYHVQGVLATPIATPRLHVFLVDAVSKHSDPAVRAEIFPKQRELTTKKLYGNWLRLPGPHHTKDHWTRVWDGSQWLDGGAAVEAILRLRPNPTDLIPLVAVQGQPSRPNRQRQDARNGARRRADREMAIKALEYISPDLPYDQWLTVGQALHSVGVGAAMLEVWTEWSRRSGKFVPGQCAEKWDTFDANGGTTVATLVYMAQQTNPNFPGRGSRMQDGPQESGGRPDDTVGTGVEQARDDHAVGDGTPVGRPGAGKGSEYGVLTDYGNAQRLVGRHGHDLRFDGTRGWWMTFDGRRWVRDESGEAMRRTKESARSMWKQFAQEEDPQVRGKLLKHAKQSEQRGGLESALKLAQSEPNVAETADDLDTDPMLFNVLNGTVDLRTGELREHRREDLVTKLAPDMRVLWALEGRRVRFPKPRPRRRDDERRPRSQAPAPARPWTVIQSKPESQPNAEELPDAQRRVQEVPHV